MEWKCVTMLISMLVASSAWSSADPREDGGSDLGGGGAEAARMIHPSHFAALLGGDSSRNDWLSIGAGQEDDIIPVAAPLVQLDVNDARSHQNLPNQGCVWKKHRFRATE
jgi:hypothetical protein